MGNLISKIQSISGILSIFLLIVVIALLVCVVSLFLEVNRLNQKYRVFMKGRDGQSLEKSFRRKFAMIDKGLDAAAANEQEIEKLKEIMGNTLNKYAIVKYDTFEDMGGKLSFVLAMLDDKNTGFLLNAIHSRENCFLYIKEIVNGESYVILSQEEVQALKQAVNFRQN